MRRLGASADWNLEYFTMDEKLSAVVREAFIKLYQQGLIYRGKRLINWDPVLMTAVSDLEVVSEEEQGSIWEIHYPLLDDSGHLTVATTRPETMLGDTAIMVHPDDLRYQHLIGKQVRLPLTDRVLPIIGDSYVDPSFGTGVVKVTPAHDFNDYAVGERHKLPTICILKLDASISEDAPEAYRGLDRFEARKRIVNASGWQVTASLIFKLLRVRGDHCPKATAVSILGSVTPGSPRKSEPSLSTSSRIKTGFFDSARRRPWMICPDRKSTRLNSSHRT